MTRTLSMQGGTVTIRDITAAAKSTLLYHIVCILFDLILYVLVNNFSVMMGWVYLGLTIAIKARINVSCSV